jgi:predicted nucleic acid-binding protein
MIVLDAGAMMALCKRENGAFNMRRLLEAHRPEVLVHAVNSLEIFYGIEREFGRPYAERVWNLMDKNDIQTRSDFDRPFLCDAAFVKNSHKMSLADSFAVALARRLNCALVSTDHHELDPVHAAGVCNVIFVR